MQLYFNGKPIYEYDSSLREDVDALAVRINEEGIVRTTQSEYNKLTTEQKRGAYMITGTNTTPELMYDGKAAMVEEYDKDGWHVRKWSSGYVEMLAHKLFQCPNTSFQPIATGEALHMASGVVTPIPYPIQLTKKYIEIAVSEPDGTLPLAGWAVPRGVTGQISLTQTMEYSYYRVKSVSQGTVDMWIGYFITGRWK